MSEQRSMESKINQLDILNREKYQTLFLNKKHYTVEMK